MNYETLIKTVRGTVTTQMNPEYDSVRQDLIWNGRKPYRYPEIIIKAKDAADVQAAVKFAASTGRRVSPRGGGHQFSGIALQDCVVIDLSEMNALEIDVEAKTARAQPTVTNGKLAAALGDVGLAFPTGHCTSVPLSGYLLGGGFGWNAGEWGIACHNVIGVQVVLADGSLIEASETENPDIFWAVRGAGPEFFGVVTEYRIRVFDLPRAIRTSVWTYAIEEIDAVESWISRTMPIVPRNVEFTAMMSSAPEPLAGVASKTVTGIATIFADTEEEAAATLALIADGAPEGALDVQLGFDTTFEVLYLIVGQSYPEGHRYAVDTNWSADPSGLLTRLANAVKEAPSPRSYAIGVVLPPMDGRAMPDGAFSMAGPAFSSTYAIWPDEDADAANFDWLRDTSAAIAPISLGHYVGEADLDVGGKLERCYAPEALARLRALQHKYDPRGMFKRRIAAAPMLRMVG